MFNYWLRLILCISFFYGSDHAHAQRSETIRKVQIISKENNYPIPYVHAGIINSDLGYVSDENGFITIYPKSFLPGDSIYFRAIGFHPVQYLMNDLDSQVLLESEVYTLKEVLITPFSEIVKVGGTKPTSREINWEGLEMLGTEMGTYITDAPEGKLINAVNFFVKKNRCDSILFRMRIYESDEQFGDLRQLLSSDMTFKIGNDRKWIRVPLVEQNLMTNKKVILITVEALKMWGASGDKPPFSLTYDKAVNGFGTFRQFSRQKGWGGYTFKGRGLSFNLEYYE